SSNAYPQVLGRIAASNRFNFTPHASLRPFPLIIVVAIAIIPAFKSLSFGRINSINAETLRNELYFQLLSHYVLTDILACTPPGRYDLESAQNAKRSSKYSRHPFRNSCGWPRFHRSETNPIL